LTISRRDFFKISLALLVTSNTVEANDISNITVIPIKSKYKMQETRKLKNIRKTKDSIYLLKMYNPNTNEVIVSRFHKNKKIPEKEIRKISYFLRDFHENKVKKIDQKLIFYLAEILRKTKKGKYIVVHSAYRTKKTNKFLKEHGYKTATKSMHIKAKAIDFHINGYSSYKSYLITKKINPGGLGYYKSQKFIHMDTGRRRFWLG